MKTNDSTALYANSISFPEENRVPGFDPLRFLKMTSVGPKLDLSTKKVWFRLKYPQGRIILSAQKMDQQLALIEARVFLNKSDTAPAFTTVVQRMLNEVPGGLYVQAAQNAAVEQVLDEAGFTVRFNNAPVSSANVPAVQTEPVKQPAAETKPAVKQAVIEQPVVKAEPVSVPAAEKAAIPEETASVVEAAPAAVIAETVTETAAENAVEQITTAEAKEANLSESVSENTLIAETVSAPVLETIPMPTANESKETTSAEGTAPYTISTPVEEICQLMSLQEALEYVITSGSCKGWTMAQAIARRPASVRFYTTPGYKGDDNILRASAAIVLKDLERLAKAS